MDWSGDLAGRPLRPYMDAIVLATIERLEISPSTANRLPLSNWLVGLEAWRDQYEDRPIHFDSDPANSMINSPYQDVGIGQLIDDILGEIIVDDADDPWDRSRGVSPHNDAYFACNHTHSSGNWHLYSDDETLVGRRWDWDDMLADIGDPARILVIDTGKISAAWLKQVYEILNRIKWFVARQAWYTVDYPTNYTSSRQADSTIYRPTLAGAKSIAETNYNAASDTTAGGGNDNPTKYSNVLESAGTWFADLFTRNNRISVKKHSELAFDFDVYALVEGYEEFDDHGVGLTEGSYNLYDSGSIALADAWPYFYDQALLGDTTRPSWFAGTPATGGANNRRGFEASAPIIVRKYDVTDGFAFLA